MVYPKGDSTVKNPAISVYLFLCDCLPSEKNVFCRIQAAHKGSNQRKAQRK